MYVYKNLLLVDYISKFLYLYSGYASNPLNIDYSSAAVGLGGHCNDFNITTEDASAARSTRGARPLDLKEVPGRSVLATSRQRAGF